MLLTLKRTFFLAITVMLLGVGAVYAVNQGLRSIGLVGTSVNSRSDSNSRFPAPPNATVIGPPPQIDFSLLSNITHVAIPNGGSMTIPIGLYATGSANISLSISQQDFPESSVLPSGIMATFDPSSVTTTANMTIMVNLTLNIEESVPSGIYRFDIAGSHRTAGWHTASGIYLEVTIP